MAAISRDDVAHLAKLARIEMTPDELDHMAIELDQILGAVKRVQEVATADIPPTSHPLSMSNISSRLHACLQYAVTVFIAVYDALIQCNTKALNAIINHQSL